MKRKSMVIGIDGGGTKTAGRLTDNNAITLAEHQGGSSNMQILGANACAEIFFELIKELCIKCGCEINKVDSIAIGLAGAGRISDQKSVFNVLSKKLNLSKTILTIISDADIALEAAYGDQPGIILIAGTGSIIYGRQTDGNITRMGGWGPVIGDPGSGSDIGLKALQKLSLFFDGRAEKSELFAVLADSYGIASAESLIDKVYSEKLQPSGLTQPVFQAAIKGDKNATDILNQAADGLIQMLDAYLSGFSKMQEIPVTLKGGLLEHDSIYRQIVVLKIGKLPYPVSIASDSKEAIDGAISLALRKAGNYLPSAHN